MADKRRGSGEGSITFDRDKDRWVGRLPRDERGRRAKVTGKTRSEVQRKLRDKLRDQGLTITAGRTTLRAYLEQWMRDTVTPSGLAAQTKQKHEIAVRCHLVPGLGRVQLAKLTPAHVQRWMRDELDAGKGVATVQVAHSTLRQALEQAVLWGLVPRNVARLVKAPAAVRTERRPFTAAEQTAILEAAQGDRLFLMVVLAQATGLRQSELLGIRWVDIDLDARVLHLRKQLGRDGKLKELKTQAGKRTLPLPSRVVDLLRAHRAAQQCERAGALVWEDHDLMLSTSTGRPIGQRNAHRSWSRILERAGVEHRGIHHLRHAYVTMLAEQGVHERVAQQLAGHADSRVTREVYTHVTTRMLDVAVSAIEGAVLDVHGQDSRAVGPQVGPHSGEGANEERN